jgi:tetratricopeptide (TPR) repeat protein
MWETIRAGVGIRNRNPGEIMPYRSLRCLLLWAVVACCLASCTTTYGIYYGDMLRGKSALQLKDYEKARASFEGAAAANKDGKSIAYLATAEYKLNHLDKAGAYAQESLELSPYGYYSLRARGYDALVQLRKDRVKGLSALQDYVNWYQLCDPMMSIDEIRVMMEKREIDLVTLERLIDEQAGRYETDIEDYQDLRTGFYERWSGGDRF